MADEARSCPSCGASVPPEAAACDLCGTLVNTPDEASDDTAAIEEDPAAESEDAESGEAEVSGQSVYCHDCGWENPPDANYCSQCGTELQDLTDAATPDGTRPVAADLPSGSRSSEPETEDPGDTDEQAEMGQQILAVIGTAVLLVVGLFFLTQWSQQYEWGNEGASVEGETVADQQAPSGEAGPSSTAGGPTGGRSGTPSPQAAAASDPTDLSTLVDELGGSVDGSVADRVDSVETALEGAEGEQQRKLQIQLSNLYVGAGIPSRAAFVQSQLADQTGRIEDRRRAGDLLYKWMRKVQQEQGRRAKVADVARHVANAYAAVAEARPQDLGARTRMGESYLLTNNPMKGIQAINQVLDDDSTFVPARFQKGLALLQINRLDQAVEQFEKVMASASEDDPFYQQAKRAIEVIREQSGASGQGTSGSR